MGNSTNQVWVDGVKFAFHVAGATVAVVVVALAAIALALFATWMKTLEVPWWIPKTFESLELALFVLDVMLFTLYVGAEAWRFAVSIIKR
jgi:hypothetical protein